MHVRARFMAGARALGNLRVACSIGCVRDNRADRGRCHLGADKWWFTRGDPVASQGSLAWHGCPGVEAQGTALAAGYPFPVVRASAYARRTYQGNLFDLGGRAMQ